MNFCVNTYSDDKYRIKRNKAIRTIIKKLQLLDSNLLNDDRKSTIISEIDITKLKFQIENQELIPNDCPTKQRIKKVNKNRFLTVYNFITNKLDLNQLNSGQGVMDVAGGCGELSYFFTCLNNIKSTIIDPRIVESALFKKINRRKQHIIARDKGLKYTYPNLPPKIKLPFISKLIDRELNVNDFILSASKHFQFNQFEVDYSNCNEVSNLENQKENQENINNVDENQMQNVVNQCSLMIGLHPDQATDHIIDYCQNKQIKFLVIPCCVFPKENTHRMIDGERVQNQDQYIKQIMTKQDGLKIEQLDFSGRNLAIYNF